MVFGRNSARQKSSVFMELKEGEGFFNVNSKIKDAGLQFGTPTTALGVRGTKFSLVVDKDGNSRVSLLEGKVSYRLRIPELEILPPEVIETNVELKKELKKLEETYQKPIQMVKLKTGEEYKGVVANIKNEIYDFVTPDGTS